MDSKVNVLKPHSKICTIKCTNFFFINFNHIECRQKYNKNRKIQDLYKYYIYTDERFKTN